MIFGETGSSKKFGPNINNDRVVSFSKNSRNNLDDESPYKHEPAAKPKIKSKTKSGIKSRLKLRLANSPVAEVLPIKAKKKIDILSSDGSDGVKVKKGKITNLTITLPSQAKLVGSNKKAKAIDLLTPEEEKDVSNYLSEILTSPVSKSKKLKSANSVATELPKKKKSTKLSILAGALDPKIKISTKVNEDADLELEQLKKQLHAKFTAVAEEEGVEMIFDVDAALDPFSTSKSKPKTKIKKLKSKKSQKYCETLSKEKAITTVETNIPEAKPRIILDDEDVGSSYVEIDVPEEKTAAKKRRLIAQRKLGTQYVSVVPNAKADRLNAEELASNVVDIPEKEIIEFRKSTQALTRKYIDFMRKDLLPHLIALDSAIDYTQALMQDGLAREDLKTDDSLLITLRWMLHRKATKFFGETLNCKMDSEQFDQVISELYKTDLLKCTTYTSDTVGVVRRKDSSNRASNTNSILGVVSTKSTTPKSKIKNGKTQNQNQNSDSNSRRNTKTKG